MSGSDSSDPFGNAPFKKSGTICCIMYDHSATVLFIEYYIYNMNINLSCLVLCCFVCVSFTCCVGRFPVQIFVVCLFAFDL